MKYSIQTITTHVKSSSRPAILLIFESQRYLFNAGEGTQRFFHDRSIKMTNLQTIFLTRLHMDTLGGLPGLIMTLADKSNDCLDIVGPVGATHYLASAKSFLMRRQLKVSVADIKQNSANIFQDSNLLVRSCILVPDTISSAKNTKRQRSLLKSRSRKRLILSEMFSPESKKSKSFIDSDQVSDSSEQEEDNEETIMNLEASLCYICKGPTLPGKFDAKKADELKIPRGSERSNLVKGLNVTLASGETIEPHQVVGPPTDGTIVVILDVPSINHIKSLIENESLKAVCTDNINPPRLIYHFAAKNIIEDDRYLHWIKSTNPSAQHVFLGEGFESQEQTFQSAGHFHSLLNEIDDEIFPKLECSSLGELPVELQKEKRFMIGKEVEEFQLAPKFKLLPRTNSITRVTPDSKYFHAVRTVKKNLKTVDALPNYTNEFVLALGTGSCIPSRLRNVSGTFLYHPQGSILFDVGEGSLSQLRLAFGNEIDRYLKSLKLLFISHLHGDHQLGAFSVINEWRYANRRTNNRLIVVAPRPFYDWMGAFSVLSDYGYDQCDFLDCQDILDGQVQGDTLSNIFKNTNLKYFKTVAVNHCYLSFAGTAEYQNGFKVSFSGDCRPSTNFAKLGINSDLLIHEATFNDCFSKDAVKKKHSTFSEALDVAKSMKAKCVLLTHFSQRVSKCHQIPQALRYDGNVAVALDLMRIPMKSFKKMPILNSEALHSYFGKEEEDLEEGLEDVVEF